MEGANLARSVEHYDSLARDYDRATRLIDAVRRRTMAALQLRSGDVVLDAGCGTGWCLDWLAAQVGPSGQVIGFDPSPEMLAIARARVAPQAAGRVTLMVASAESVQLPARPTAILFSYTHDLIRSCAALGNLFGQAAPGARVASTSTKLYAPWLAPANWWLKMRHRGYITNFEGFDAPWSLLAQELDDFRVATGPFTQHYVATGRVKAARNARVDSYSA
jgi:SAM-dependent methyltransferase